MAASKAEVVLEEAQKVLGPLLGWVTLARILRKLNKQQVREAVDALRAVADRLEKEFL